MRKIKFLLSLLSLILFYSCGPHSENNSEKAKKEIARAEKDFEKMAADKGIAEAFSFFADSAGIVKTSSDSLIHGKEDIKKFFSRDHFKTATVTWSPDFIEASASGDLGYTYGKYKWISKDSSGKSNQSTGIFHTTWKRQKDGSWKFVFD